MGLPEITWELKKFPKRKNGKHFLASLGLELTITFSYIVCLCSGDIRVWLCVEAVDTYARGTVLAQHTRYCGKGLVLDSI